MSNISTVPFHGTKLITTKLNDIVYVAMKPIVEAIGLDWSSQARKLQKTQQKYGCSHMTIPTKSGIQEMLFIPLRKLNGWLFSINPEKVREDLRDKVIQYQEECFEVLYRHFMPKIESQHKTIKELPMDEGVLVRLPKIDMPVLGVTVNNNKSVMDLECFHYMIDKGSAPILTLLDCLGKQKYDTTGIYTEYRALRHLVEMYAYKADEIRRISSSRPSYMYCIGGAK